MMKRYITTLLVLISMMIVFIGVTAEVRWGGIVSWSLALILLCFAAYYTKYIPNRDKNNKQHLESE